MLLPALPRYKRVHYGTDGAFYYARTEYK